MVAAKENDMLHRDIKPDNIMFTDKGLVKLTDLGIAKSTAPQDDHLTQVASIFGTPTYMSPEQARDASKVDIRADIYSVGCVLFKMLTGRPPYVGDNPVAILTQVLDDEKFPSVREFDPDIPASVAHLVADMCDKDCDSRIQSPEELLERIDSIHLDDNGDSLVGRITSKLQSLFGGKSTEKKLETEYHASVEIAKQPAQNPLFKAPQNKSPLEKTLVMAVSDDEKETNVPQKASVRNNNGISPEGFLSDDITTSPNANVRAWRAKPSAQNSLVMAPISEAPVEKTFVMAVPGDEEETKVPQKPPFRHYNGINLESAFSDDNSNSPDVHDTFFKQVFRQRKVSQESQWRAPSGDFSKPQDFLDNDYGSQSLPKKGKDRFLGKLPQKIVVFGVIPLLVLICLILIVLISVFKSQHDSQGNNQDEMDPPFEYEESFSETESL